MKKATCVIRKWLFGWRRRESNESPQDTEVSILQGVTKEATSLGVPQEYSDTTMGRCVTFTDTRLVSVAKLWMELPELLKDRLEALCLQSDTMD